MGYPLFFHIVPSLFSGFGIESCALGLTAITGVVPGDIHPVGVADILFVINAVGGTAINRKAGAWMFRSVGVSVLLRKVAAAGFFGRHCAGTVDFDVADTATVVFVMDTSICAAG